MPTLKFRIGTCCLALIIMSCVISCSEDDEEIIGNGDDNEITFKPLLAYDMEDGLLDDEFLGWEKSVYDDTRALSGSSSIKITTSPGNVLPDCGGKHSFAGRALFSKDKQVTQGKTLWYRVMLYIPDSFSFGHKYSVGDDQTDADACGQNADGNLWVKWMVLSPTTTTARVYLMPSGQRRAAEDRNQIRVISESLHKPRDFDVSFPKNEWFSLQIAVKVSSGDDGFIRAWLNDEFLGEVVGKTFPEGASIKDWGIGDYWNGIPWTDGEDGRTDFWMEEIILASDMDGYGAPDTEDADGRAYISSETRVADFN